MKGFYARRSELLEQIIDFGTLTATEKLVGFKLLLGYMNREHETAYMSSSTLAEDFNVRPETVRRALAKLVELGFLSRQRRPQRTTIYWMGETWRAADDPGPGAPGDRRSRADRRKANPRRGQSGRRWRGSDRR